MAFQITENGYKEIFNSNPAAILILDPTPNYIILDVNQAYLNATNSSREALIGNSVFAVFPANPTNEISKNIALSISSFEEAIQTKQRHTLSNYRYDIPIRGTEEFEERYWITTNTPILDEKGNVAYLIHSPTDVTELHQLRANRIAESGRILDLTAQKKAKEEQQKLLTLVAYSVDLMSVLNMDGTNSYINKAGRALLGFETEAQVFETPISQLHTPEDFEQVQKEVLPMVMEKGEWAGRMMVKHLQTGEIIPVFNNSIRINDPETGEVIGIGAVMRDLRPELAAKQALADSERLLRSITSAAPTGLWMSDEDGIITYVNQTWLDWTGMSYESQLGEGWINNVIDEDRERANTKFMFDLKHRNMYEVEFRINHIDGTVRWCVATGMPQYLSDGSFSGYIGACTDITEQKNLQQQKDDFIGIASHELKTPVTSIKAYAQVLERMLRSKGDLKEAAMIHKMDVQINRLTSLIGDLLDVTKINAGKLQFNNRYFDFNELVSEVVEDLQRTTEQHQLIENLQPTGIVYGDKERIGQVITNFITNAIKYSPDAKEIIISSKIEDDEVRLCVEDFGIGISEDKLHQVFEQFYRVSGDMQHTFPGLGLGLYISSEIIKRENGRIWAISTLGKGSTFCFALTSGKSLKQMAT